jgi:hypothetical protein
MIATTLAGHPRESHTRIARAFFADQNYDEPPERLTLMDEPRRGPILTTFTILFLLMALSDFGKPYAHNPQVGLVFFGIRLHDTINAVIAPLFGLYLLMYAAGIWRMKWYALPMAWLYALYVLTNLVLFRVRSPQLGVEHSIAFLIFYAIVAIGVSWGSALLLTIRRAELI